MRRITIGIAAIIIGIMMMAYTGINMITNEKIADAGSIKITTEKSHLMEWSPFVGVALFVGGILIFIQAKRSLK